MEVREGLDLLNTSFKDYMIAVGDPKRRPWYTRNWVFWILSISLLSWPLRLLIEYRTAYVHYQVTKLFGTNYLSPSSINYTGPLRRDGTMDSRELEAAISNNFFIVPSYSEAMLMDPFATTTYCHQDGQGNLHIRTSQRYRGANRQGLLSNEGVIPNYGALIGEGMPILYNQRSRSLSIARHGDLANRRSQSFSFGNLVGLARMGNCRSLDDDAEGDYEIPEDPPPPYEVAMQMCRPLLARMKRSFTSDSGKFKALRNENDDENHGNE